MMTHVDHLGWFDIPEEGLTMTKTIPTDILPDSAFRDTAGIPTPIADEPTRKVTVAQRPYISPYTSEMRCACGAIVEGVDPAKLLVQVYRSKRLQRTITTIIHCPLCPR